MKRNYVGIHWMQGYTQRMDFRSPLVRLTALFDWWIERNSHIPAQVSVSRRLKYLLDEEAGYEIEVLGTLLGDYELTVHNSIKELVVTGRKQ